MPMSFPAFALGAVLIFAAAPGMPTFDARPGCQAGANTGIELQGNVDACVKGELQARDALATQWHEFSAAERSQCVSLTSMGGPPSYIEVLTCLEMARDARGLHVD